LSSRFCTVRRQSVGAVYTNANTSRAYQANDISDLLYNFRSIPIRWPDFRALCRDRAESGRALRPAIAVLSHITGPGKAHRASARSLSGRRLRQHAMGGPAAHCFNLHELCHGAAFRRKLRNILKLHASSSSLNPVSAASSANRIENCREKAKAACRKSVQPP
jgi:hypothetical protein